MRDWREITKRTGVPGEFWVKRHTLLVYVASWFTANVCTVGTLAVWDEYNTNSPAVEFMQIKPG